MKNRLIITFILSLSLWSCKKEEDLPRPTQEGANTFGCLINGEIWKPKGRVGFSNNLEHSFFGDNYFSITAYRSLSDDDQQFVSIFVLDVLELYVPGTYDLSDPEEGTATYDNFLACSYYQYDPLVTRSGTLNITRFDSGIIAGTFEFTLEKLNCETIHVTEGRFDLTYRT